MYNTPPARITCPSRVETACLEMLDDFFLAFAAIRTFCSHNAMATSLSHGKVDLQPAHNFSPLSTGAISSSDTSCIYHPMTDLIFHCILLLFQKETSDTWIVGREA